jgi:hypothetical protein
MTNVLWAAGATLLLAGCASAPPPAPVVKPEVQATLPYVIIQNELSVVGGTVPSWVTMDNSEIQAQPEYKDVYVFKFDGGEAKSLDGARIVTRKIDAADQIASMVRQRIQAKFSGAQVGDKDKVATYFENVVKSLADAKITGFKQEKEFWVQIEYKKPDGTLDPDRIYYRYFVLYSVPKATLDALLKSALDAADTASKPLTPDEATARAQVKEAFAKGF